MTPTLLLDANAMCHKVKHTLDDLTHETMRVGIIFGFFMQLLKLAKEQESNQFVFCWDSQKSLRTKIFPAYKERRRTEKSEKTDEEKEIDKQAYAQFELLYTEIIPAIGFQNNYKFDGFEGDDIIASVVDNNPLDDFLIVSGDEDMYQCLCEGVEILNGKGRFTEEDFKKQYGIPPTMWASVKAIAGCKSDEVPGIRGVGEIKAIQYLLGDMAPHLKAYQSISCPEGKQVIARNKPLVALPFKGTPDVFRKPDKALSLDAFMDMCKKYDFQYFLKKDTLSQFKQCMNMR